jgi:hypothetical protein
MPFIICICSASNDIGTEPARRSRDLGSRDGEVHLDITVALTEARGRIELGMSLVHRLTESDGEIGPAFTDKHAGFPLQRNRVGHEQLECSRISGPCGGNQSKVEGGLVFAAGQSRVLVCWEVEAEAGDHWRERESVLCE